MIEKLRKAILKNDLLRVGDHALVAVSGGADSVGLLFGLHRLAPKLGVRLTVAHLDHRLRGQSARGDAQFVRQLAAELGLPFVEGRANVRQLAQRRKISLEMAARQCRYRFLKRVAVRVGADVIVTAHTADDQAETILLNLCRGASLRGLGGIKPCSRLRGTRIIRPMLEISHREVVAFLSRHGVTWRTDETNRDVTIPRNWIRHEVLPLIESRLNPSIREVLSRTAFLLREEDKWLEKYCRGVASQCVKKEAGKKFLDILKVRALDRAVRRRVLRWWLAAVGIPAELIDFDVIERLDGLVMQQVGTGEIQLTRGWHVFKRYDRLFAVRISGREQFEPYRVRVAVPGETLLTSQGLRILVTIEPGVFKERGRRPGLWPARASLSWSALRHRNLYARTWRSGDRMRPLGLKGSKKVQDIFVDSKVPIEERRRVPIFECGHEIVWIPGYRVAEGWQVENKEKQALQITVDRIPAAGQRTDLAGL